MSLQKHGSTRGDKQPTLVGWRSVLLFFFLFSVFVSIFFFFVFNCGPLLAFRKHPVPTSLHQFISTSFWYVCLRILTVETLIPRFRIFTTTNGVTLTVLTRWDDDTQQTLLSCIVFIYIHTHRRATCSARFSTERENLAGKSHRTLSAF